MPKNKDISSFIKGVQQKSFKEEYLDKKEIINSLHQKLQKATDLPVDHTYGQAKKESVEANINDIIKNRFGNADKPEQLLNIEKNYKPQYLKNRLKPPKPTTSS